MATINLDTELGFNDNAVVPTKKIKLFGREWTILCDVNSFSMAQIAGGDASGISKFLLNLVLPDQTEDFAAALNSQKGMDGEKLGQLLAKLIEVAGERPTEQPSPSRRTAKKAAPSLRSVGRSS